MHPLVRLTALALAFAAVPTLTSRAQSSGSATLYGCGVNPPGSLLVLGGSPVIGTTLTVGVDNPLGTQISGLAFLAYATAPQPNYPCGLLLPAFGMAPGPGELLLQLGAGASSWIKGPVPWTGMGSPATFALAIPSSTALVGKHVYLQGAVFDGALGLSEALDLLFGSSPGTPAVHIETAWVEPIPVAPGETVRLHVLVANDGTAAAPNVVVQGSETSGNTASTAIAALAPGQNKEVVLAYATSGAWTQSNPHVFTAQVQGEPSAFSPKKPAFVVSLQLVQPSLEDEVDEMFAIQNAAVVNHTYANYGPNGGESVNQAMPDPAKGQEPPPSGGPPPQPRIDPAVVLADQQAAPGELIEYVVKYDHGVEMPRLPQLVDRSSRFAPANVAVFEQRMSRLEAVRRARLTAMGEVLAPLQQAGGELVELFTLAGSMRVKAPKGHLAVFEVNPKVQHVEGLHQGHAIGDLVDVRALLETDPYFDLGATGSGFVAVIDSGVKKLHDLLTSPSHLDFIEDCFDGDDDCNDTGDPGYDHQDDCNHGTFMAGTITGNSNLGDANRGISSITVDVWKIMLNDDSCIGDGVAVLRAFDEAVKWGDHIVNCAFIFPNSLEDETGSIADAADDAFNSGCVVIAGMGNDGGPAGTVGSPALAHKVLGIGAYNVDTLGTEIYQSLGPTADDRIKPDLQAPTDFYGADATDVSGTWILGGTSSATGAATGAAAIFSDWFALNSQDKDSAGRVYAALINGGPIEWNGGFSNTTGVGRFELPLDGTFFSGSRNVGFQDNEYVTIDVPTGATEISAAIWWGEKPSQNHRDIDLYLQKPDGSTSDSSLGTVTVFEHLKVTAPITSGTRKVRIYGYDVPLTASVTVYYAIHVKF